MDKILQMKQKRAEVIASMRVLVSGAESAQRALTDDEKQKYEELRAQAAALADDIVREEELRSLEGSVPPQSGIKPAARTEEQLENGIRAARFVKSVLLASRSRTESAADIAARCIRRMRSCALL